MLIVILTSIALFRNKNITKVKFIVLSLISRLHVMISIENVFFKRYFSIMTMSSYVFAFVIT